ncbi:MAG: acylneuraminate cytidylyltransferase family protein [Gemmataceae bacterium]|nr:acylneuraminate cytidylyltransferase family protein [Gemmataceae bacterium]
MRVLHLILARGGSKGIPGKNLKRLGGLSLVGFKAIAARKSRYCHRLIISTDSPEIQEEARRHGVEVPFTRPAELATDTARSVDAIWHAMQFIESEGKDRFDAVMLLEPSSPFARPSDLDEAVELMIREDAAVVVGMRQMEVSSIYVGTMDEHGRITSIIDKMGEAARGRRQDHRPEYTMNGALYLFRWDHFSRHRNIYADRERTYGLVMPDEYSIEIDSPINLAFAEFLVERGIVDRSHWNLA